MPLEPISHHDRQWTRISRVIGIVLLGAALLAGCAEGTASDAERGRAEDAERGSVLRDLQATETYRLVNNTGGTPSPEPGQE